MLPKRDLTPQINKAGVQPYLNCLLLSHSSDASDQIPHGDAAGSEQTGVQKVVQSCIQSLIFETGSYINTRLLSTSFWCKCRGLYQRSLVMTL
jgi:hypothetical protein